MSDWLTVREVEEQFGFTRASLELWRVRGCLALGKQKPRCGRAPTTGQRREQPGRGANLFYKPDLARIAKVPLASDPIKDTQGRWITTTEATRAYGLSRVLLQKYRTKVYPLLGGRIGSKRFLVRTPGGSGETYCRYVWFYKESDLAKIATASARDDLVKKDWLSASEAKKRFGFDKQLLLTWRNRRCVHLAGRKLSAEKMPAQIRGCIHSVWKYSRRDLETIARHQQCPGKAETFQDEFGNWLSAQDVNKLHGVRPSILAYWRTIERVRAKQIPCPAGKASAHKRLWLYNAADVERAATLPDGRSRTARASKATTDPIKATSSPDRPTTRHDMAGRRRGRPSAMVRHQKWKQEHDAGLSLERIARKYKVTRRAVAAGIEKARASELNSQPE
jgi:hypothetical protein